MKNPMVHVTFLICCYLYSFLLDLFFFISLVNCKICIFIISLYMCSILLTLMTYIQLQFKHNTIRIRTLTLGIQVCNHDSGSQCSLSHVNVHNQLCDTMQTREDCAVVHIILCLNAPCLISRMPNDPRRVCGNTLFLCHGTLSNY